MDCGLLSVKTSVVTDAHDDEFGIDDATTAP